MSAEVEGVEGPLSNQFNIAANAILAQLGIQVDGTITPVQLTPGQVPPPGTLAAEITGSGTAANIQTPIVALTGSGIVLENANNTGPQAVFVGGSNNTATTGAGGDAIFLQGNSNRANAGGGSDSVVVSATSQGNEINGGSGPGADTASFITPPQQMSQVQNLSAVPPGASAVSARAAASAAPPAGSSNVADLSVDALGRVVMTSTSGGSTALSGFEYVQLTANSYAAIVQNADQGAVARLYQAILGRTVDQPGFESWKDGLDSGRSLSSIANDFLNSQEAQQHLAQIGANQSTTAFVTSLYESLLARQPDATGLAGWVAAIDQGTLSKADVALAFATSAEGIVVTDNNNTVIVNIAREAAFTQDAAGGRIVTSSAADEQLSGTARNDLFILGDGSDTVVAGSGFDQVQINESIGNYAARIEDGAYVVTNLRTAGDTTIHDAEYVKFSDAVVINASTTEEAVIARMYHAVLDRSADASGLEAYWNAENNGLSLKSIADSFLGSAEFQAQHGGLSNADFVTLMYDNLLHRSPDTTGFNSYVQGLESGQISRADVVVSFAASAEAEAKTAGTINIIGDHS